MARMSIDLIDELAWSCIFVDEVHNIKNSKASITLALNKFDCLVRFGLTVGTFHLSPSFVR